MEYFDDEPPAGDGLCSDNECPCPQVIIPRGTGYLFIEQWIVDFRRRYRTQEAARNAEEQKTKEMNARFGGAGVRFYRLGPLLVCEQGARLRSLDLDVAAADAKHWWETGQVPLRATPLAGSKPKGATDAPAREWWRFWK